MTASTKWMFAALILVAGNLGAQAIPSDSASPASIEDNSFIVEEAYNQDAGVVQHISGLSIDRTAKSYEYDFTEEWPVGSIRHQLSYTLPVVHTSDPGATGIGDVLINYRYQLIGDGDAKFAVAPRFSIALPTGSWKTGAGRGATGYEGFLPASIVISDLLVTHLNAGMRFTPSSRNQIGQHAGVWKYILGGSEIFRVLPNMNFLLETIWSRDAEVIGAGKTHPTDNWTVLPGVRFALNYKSGLQIVPGIGFPFGVGPGRGNHGVFLYLSFEHPFNAEGRAGK